MPRPKTLPDADVLEAALRFIHAQGPQALTFASLAQVTGLASATLVQRFGSKARLKQAALLRAWDQLDAKTADLAAQTPRTPQGAIGMLVSLSRNYGGIESYAEGLLVLREDLRDPVLRARGALWRDRLSLALDACLAEVPGLAPGAGLLVASQWQGCLLWWGFDPQGDVADHVEAALGRFVTTLIGTV